MSVSVAGATTGGDTPTGSVTFLDGATSLGSLGNAGGGVTASFTMPLTVDSSTVLDTQTLDTGSNEVSASFTAPLTVTDSTVLATQMVNIAGGGVVATFTTPLTVNGSTILETQTVDTADGGTATTSVASDGSTTMWARRW